MTEAPGLHRFNAASHADARTWASTCLDVPRWVEEVVAGRPYPDVDAAVTAAAAAADPLTPAEVERALERHPRIGERPSGVGNEARMSQSEQSGVDTSASGVGERLRAGNAAYEARFGRVFLIRAAGRDAAEVLAALEQRLGNDEETERLVVAEQLREIAVLRLRALVSGSPR